ncbi:MAG: sugar ABC transporter permease, partial [Marinobacterium sp.]
MSVSKAKKPMTLESLLPKIVLAPTTAVMLVCMYGFMIWTGALSFTKSRMLPQWDFVGFDQYAKLFA